MSLEGVSEFQVSFFDMGISASLTSGLPSRDTWTIGPDAQSGPSGLRTRAFCRLADAHTPMVEWGLR